MSPEYSFEAIAVRHPDRFEPHVTVLARERLLSAEGLITATADTESRRGRSARLILNDADADNAKVNVPLVKLIATAHRRFAALAAGEASSTGDLARREATDPSELSRTIQLASLAPDIAEKILLGQQPIDLTATRLKKLRDLPLDWPEQRKLLGFVA